jgi:hypothetical protein
LTPSPSRRENPRALLALLMIIAGTAHAEPDVLRAFAGEPGVAELQRAAVRLAGLEPERSQSWTRRARVAAVLPVVRARAGRGVGVAVTRGLDGLDRLTTADSDSWRFELEASWSLDRLIFNPEEARVGHEVQRVAARREQLLTEIARLYYARRRLQAAERLDPDARPEAALDRALAIEELTATLDGLTGGALTRGR